MADKEVPLSIVLRLVDKATAGVQAFNKRVDALTRPAREFGKALAELAEKSGFNSVVEGFKGVGDAIKETLFKVAEIGFAIGEATHLVLELVDSFAKLGHTAERAGVEADFLAGMRYAAAKSGLAVEELDGGLTTLTQNMGQAKAGTGRMLKFLTTVSPVLAQQVVHAHGTAEALGLLAAAMIKLPDPARRAALAQKTLGDAALAPLLAKGPAGIQALMTAYAGFAGSQEEAVKSSLQVEDAMVDLHAAGDGLKAALVTGLAPAIKQIVEELKEWLVEHREDVRQWAIEIGTKLPGAVHEVAAAIQSALHDVSAFVGAIGGWKVAAVALAGVMSAQLIASVVKLGVVLLATPFGWVVAGLAAITAGVIEATRVIQGLREMLKPAESDLLLQDLDEKNHGRMSPEEFQRRHPDFHEEPLTADNDPMTFARQQASLGPRMPWGFDVPQAGPTLPFMPMPARPAPAPVSAPQARVTVDFQNAPRGTRVTVDPRSTADVDLSTGYQMGGV